MNPADRVIQMLCPFKGKIVSDVPLDQLESFLLMKRERAKKTGREYREHVKADLDAIEEYLANKLKRLVVENEGDL